MKLMVRKESILTAPMLDGMPPEESIKLMGTDEIVPSEEITDEEVTIPHYEKLLILKKMILRKVLNNNKALVQLIHEWRMKCTSRSSSTTSMHLVPSLAQELHI